jgi:hypothetical protein
MTLSPGTPKTINPLRMRLQRSDLEGLHFISDSLNRRLVGGNVFARPAFRTQRGEFGWLKYS